MLTTTQLAEIRRRILLDPADDIATFARHVNEDVRALLAEVERLTATVAERGEALAKYQQACGDHQRNTFAAREDTQAALDALTSAEGDRDRAREIAVALEQENARLERIIDADQRIEKDICGDVTSALEALRSNQITEAAETLTDLLESLGGDR